MSFEMSGSCIGRMEETKRRQEDILRRAEKRISVILREEMAERWERKSTTEKAVSRGMEIIRRRITDIMRRKEEQDEHTVQKGSIGTLRAVSAH